MSASAIYNLYASIYDTTGQGRFGAYLAALTLNWLVARVAPPHSALDLACGSGGATLALAQAGMTVVGVDRSAAMLAIARGRARDAGLSVAFIERDMRDLPFEHGEPGILPDDIGFELVTCFGDSLNYLVDDGDLHRVFAGVARLIAPGAHLAFDVNAEAAFRRWDERDLITYESADCVVYNRLEFSSATRLGRGRIVWFVRGDDQRWWRGEETHIQRAWSDAEIMAALEANHFESIARLDVEGHPIAGDAELPERVIYLARQSVTNAPKDDTATLPKATEA